MHDAAALPLAGTRVVELTGGSQELVGRILADLGAEVRLVEPPGGSPSRGRGTVVDGVSLDFATRNAGKSSMLVDLSDGQDRARVVELIGGADIVLDSLGPGGMAARGLDPVVLRESFPRLVIVSLTDFGIDGPYAQYRGSNAVFAALSGFLARSGLPDRAPIVPPANLIAEAAAVEATWATLVALTHRIRTGEGRHIVVSAHETVLRVMDPAIAHTGAARSASSTVSFSHGRTDENYRYPVFASADGLVRICILAPAQWLALRAWLGDPPELADPEFEAQRLRYERWGEVEPFVTRLFAESTGAELAAEAKQRRIPLAVLVDPAEVFADPHFRARGAFGELPLGPHGAVGLAPSGFFQIDGERVGPRRGAPDLGGAEVWAAEDAAGEPSLTHDRPPLDGVRVIDLGVIIAGAELGRLFAEQGADVVKIESSGNPDADRLTALGSEMSPSFASRHRGKRSVGLNLRSERGRKILLELVGQADFVFSNFKPGTMERLGLGDDVLRAANPAVIIVESSALGSTGPRSDEMGYGPLVRATTGLTWLWRDPDVEGGFCDSFSAFPDHLAARVCAIGAIALLLRRLRTTMPGSLSVAQAEAVLNLLSETFAAQSITGARETGHQSTAQPEVSRMVRCAGDDQWCAVTLGDGDQNRLREFLGADRSGPDELIEALADWSATRSAAEVMNRLQDAGIAAGAMVRPMELRGDPQLTATGYIATADQPGLDAPLPVDARLAGGDGLPAAHLRPAPRRFGHTREVLSDLLDLDDATVEALVADGAAEADPDAAG